MQKSWNHGAVARTWRAWLSVVAALVFLCSGCTGNIDGTAPGSGLSPNAGASKLACQAGLTACNGACVNLQSESSNCGSCGVACTAPSVCANGSCDTACAAGYQKCGATCAKVATDAANCGGCGKVCEMGVPCFGGVCGCPESVLFCAGQCFDPMSDSAHCGSCETACTGGAACINGKCACATGEQLCGSECSNLNSPQHCSSCDKACAAGEICAVTSCIPSTQACPAGLTRCGDACVDLQTTAGTCGACDIKCAGGQACSAGKCGCPSGKTACGASCVDLTTSSLNCGVCGTTCTAGQSCQGGQCKCAEATDVVCDNACTDPKTDINHCGDCATKCTGGLPCTDGKCACPEGETVCDGMCVSTQTTAANCGGCGMACPVGESCQAGKCSGAFGDSCTSTPAVGISIDEISLYQVGKIPLMESAKGAIAAADQPADIIQGKAGRIRVFTKLEAGWANRTVSARLLLTNGDVKSNYFSKRSVTAASTENSMATTFNFDVKAEDFTASTRYAVEIVECDGTPAGTAGKPRFPATDNQELVTRKTGVVKIRFIPLNANGKTAATDATRLDAYKAYVALMYPASGVEYTVGPALKINQTVSAQGDGWSEALDQIANQHESDDAPADTYYFGLFQPTDNLGQYCNGGCVAGIGFVTNTQSFARHQRAALGLSYGDLTSAQTMAHEVGHNHGRPHSPCGGAAEPDPNYPYDGAKIGWWGFEAPEKLHPTTDTDIMGYCKNQWISDYTYRLLGDRIAFLNGNQREVPPPGGMQHFLFLLTDMKGPRWGIDRPKPRYPSGDPELADILDANGTVIASVTVYRTPMDHLGGALLLVPDPEPGWHAVQIHGEAPLPFGAVTSSQ